MRFFKQGLWIPVLNRKSLIAWIFFPERESIRLEACVTVRGL
jgi:hypothetical protein